MQELLNSGLQSAKNVHRKKFNRVMQNNLQGYSFILLPVLIIAVFGIYPSINVFIMSFQKFNMLAGHDKAVFTGLVNYSGIFKDEVFWTTIKNAFLFAVFVVPVQSFIALIFAVLVNQKLKGVQIFRTIFFMPVIMSFVVVSIFWKMIYDPNTGLANSILVFFHLPSQQFLTDPSMAMACVIFMCIWKSWGWYMVIFLSGLQEIPNELYEASIVDGASIIKRFFSITLPLLKRTTLFVIVMTTIDAIKIFTPIYIMTNGGPLDRTDTIVHYIWKTAFRMNEMGYAAAMSIVLFLVIFIITFVQLKVLKSDY